MYRNSDKLAELTGIVSREITAVLRSNLYEVSLGKKDRDRLMSRKKQLRDALKNSGLGDKNAKNYMKGNISSILTEKIKIGKGNIDDYMAFEEHSMLSPKDKFDIILYLFERIYGDNALAEILEVYCEENVMDVSHVDTMFSDNIRRLGFQEKLEILTQRIYENYCGLGVADNVRDMRIDGVLGGVSGVSGTYNNLWVVYKGRMLHMAFLDFGSEDELIRICMNIYRYDNPGQLSRSKGYIVGEMADHSRIVVVRPPFSESWAFFLRKFNSIEKKDIHELITDKGAHIPINIIKWIVSGCQVTAITGMQGSGKTTLLMSLIEFIPPGYTLRVQEMAFELHLREVYSDRNILTFRETDEISGEEGLDLQKKTDGNVNILGEIASNRVASLMIQTAQSGSIFTMFTHHAVTTESLIKYLRNSLLSCSIFSNENIALEQVVEAVRFDIHINKSLDGKRYVERISEIVPQKGAGEPYLINDIVVFDGDGYRLTGDFSEETCKSIRSRMSVKAREEFDARIFAK